MTTTTLHRPRALLLPGPPRRGFLLGFAGTLVVGLFLLIGLSFGLGLAYDGRALPGVRIGGESVAGLDEDAAAAHLSAALPSVATGSATLVVDGTPVEVAYASLGRGYDLPAMVAQAMAVGRTGNPVADAVTRLRSLVHPTEIAAIAHASDPAAIDAAVGSIVRQFTQQPVSAGVTYDPARGYVVTPASSGAALDPAEVRAALTDAVSRIGDSQAFTLSTRRVVPTIGTTEADAAAIAARWMVSAPLALTGADQSLTLDADTLRGLVSFGLSGGRYRPVVDPDALSERLASVADDVAQAPQDASFVWGATGITGVTPAVDGRALDVDATVASVTSALTTRARGSLTGSAALAFSLTPPAVTTVAAQDVASQMERLSSWTTYYVPGEGNYWGANISIPAHDIDKMVIAPGEWFSFWDDIGPVTFERGYGYGGAIIGGRSVANGAIAGGICSTSTTLFNAAMRAGLEIGDRTNHSYYIERYPVGLDATVFQTDTYETNMTFRNDTPDPIVIRGFTGTGWIRFEIWGVPTGRTVTLSAPIITNRRTASETTVLNPSLKPGTSVRREYPHNGFDASVTRTVRDSDGNVIWQNTWFSHYNNVNGVTEVGPAPAATPTPTPTGSPAPSPT
jgi:vancomycin resistance protein YoaR